MKNKYNAGDKVICFFLDEDEQSLTVSKETIETVSLYVDKVEYYTEYRGYPVLEKELYTPDEAIEFLTNYINKEK